MTPEERDLITGLFARLRDADTAPKDREAEDLIRRAVAEQQSAPYLMAQTILVQEHALQNAQARIAELERQLAEQRAAPAQGGGTFLGGLLGGSGGPWGRRADTAPVPQPQPEQAPRGWSQAAPQAGYAPQPGYAQPAYVPPAYGQAAPYPTTAAMAPSAGGGFLRSALTTAAGVAGGALLFQGIEGLLGHHGGAFGSGLGGYGSGYGGNETIVEENVTNNYYGDGGAQQADYGPSGGGEGGYQGGGGGYQDTSDFQPDSSDSGGDDSGGDWV
jgi:hypothetical protein